MTITPKTKALLSLAATTGATSLVIFLLAFQSRPPADAMGALQLAGGAVVIAAFGAWHRYASPPGGPADSILADVVARVEPLIMRRVVNDPSLVSLLERAEKANAQLPELHAAMIAQAVAIHLATSAANPTTEMLQAELAKTESLAASTPVTES